MTLETSVCAIIKAFLLYTQLCKDHNEEICGREANEAIKNHEHSLPKTFHPKPIRRLLLLLLALIFFNFTNILALLLLVSKKQQHNEKTADEEKRIDGECCVAHKLINKYALGNFSIKLKLEKFIEFFE